MLNERWRYSSADVKVRRDTPQRLGFEGGGSPIDRQLVDLVSAPETHLPTIIPPDSDHSTKISVFPPFPMKHAPVKGAM